jgi:hypothetical protein
VGLRCWHVDWVAQRLRVRNAYVRGEHSGEGKSDESTRRSVPVADEAVDAGAQSLRRLVRNAVTSAPLPHQSM